MPSCLEKKYEKSGMMYVEEWGDIVSFWIEEDYRLPKKKRRTNKNYFKSLQGLGFKGSYRTVCNYIQDWRNSHHNDLPSALDNEPPLASLYICKADGCQPV